MMSALGQKPHRSRTSAFGGNRVKVHAFNLAECWSDDVSADIASELRQRCDLQMRDVPFFLQDFVDRYEGRYHDYQLPLPI
jgi:hypothetical protein